MGLSKVSFLVSMKQDSMITVFIGLEWYFGGALELVVNIISVCEHIEIPDDVYSNTINCKYERSENRKEKVKKKPEQ